MKEEVLLYTLVILLRFLVFGSYISIFVLMISSCAVSRQCGGKVKTVEDKYEEERSKKKAHLEEKVSSEIQVDPVDVLPVKTLDGKLHYRTGSNNRKLVV